MTIPPPEPSHSSKVLIQLSPQPRLETTPSLPVKLNPGPAVRYRLTAPFATTIPSGALPRDLQFCTDPPWSFLGHEPRTHRHDQGPPWTTPSEPSVELRSVPDRYRVPRIGGVQGFTRPFNTGSSSGSRPASGTPQNLSNQHRWSGQGHCPHRVRSICIDSHHYTEIMGRPGR